MGIAVKMVMLAMHVMVMIVMVMTVIAIMARGVIMHSVRGALRRVGSARGVGTTFRIERRVDLDDAGAEPADHRLNDVIAPDPQALGRDLRGQMAVAEMPGDPNQMVQVVAADLRQRLRRGNHLDQPAVVKHQCVPASQHDYIFQIKQKRKAARARHRRPPPVPIVEIEHDRIGRRLSPAMRGANLRCPDHVEMLTASQPCRH
jgi:hypothetical protein